LSLTSGLNEQLNNASLAPVYQAWHRYTITHAWPRLPTIKELSEVQDKNEQKALMQKSGELIAEILEDDLAVTHA